MNFNQWLLAFCVTAFIIVIVVGGYMFISRQTSLATVAVVVSVGFAVFILLRLVMG